MGMTERRPPADAGSQETVNSTTNLDEKDALSTTNRGAEATRDARSTEFLAEKDKPTGILELAKAPDAIRPQNGPNKMSESARVDVN